MTRTFLMLSLGLLLSAQVAAAPIYRCGADGKTYSQTPCPEGSIVEATDPRSAAQRAEAKRFVEAERQRAAAMERDRKAAEKAAAKEAPGAIGIGPVAADKPASAAGGGKKKGAKNKPPEKDFSAVVPKTAAPAR